MIQVLLDTNIILDFALDRDPFIKEAEDILKLAFEKKFFAFISATTITDIYYITRKQKGIAETKSFLKSILAFIEVAEVNKEIVTKALNSNLKDFEDAVQVESAEYNRIDMIITRNIKDFRDVQTEIITPEKFMLKFK